MTTLMEPVAPWLRDLNRLFTSDGNQFLPPADVLVTDDGVSVYMDVPGLKAEDLDIELENVALRVPRGLDPEAIDASLHDGVLNLRIPKPEALKPHRIQVKEESGDARQIEGASA